VWLRRAAEMSSQRTGRAERCCASSQPGDPGCAARQSPFSRRQQRRGSPNRSAECRLDRSARAAANGRAAVESASGAGASVDGAQPQPATAVRSAAAVERRGSAPTLDCSSSTGCDWQRTATATSTASAASAAQQRISAAGTEWLSAPATVTQVDEQRAAVDSSRPSLSVRGAGPIHGE